MVEDLVGSLGTGVIINEACVVTAAHVVADSTTQQVTTERGTVYPTVRAAYDEAQDIAVLCSAKNFDAPSATVGPVPTPYDPVFTIGFPLGFKYFLTEGRWQEGHMISAPCAPGNSGGGVFDSNGMYVGFVDSVAVYHPLTNPIVLPHLCDVIDAGKIVSFLSKHHITYARGA